MVVPGDTLWDLAMAYYQDNYLWPVIWDANRWVKYSHWIYPGDPLVIPPNPTVVPPEPPEPPVEKPVPIAVHPVEPEPEPEPVEPATPVPTGPILRPVADTTELYCSSMVAPSYERPSLSISAFEEPLRLLAGEGDVVYLGSGLQDGIQPGDVYTVVRRGEEVQHPDSGEPYGVIVEWLGRVEVLAVQATTATAEIVFSCRAINVGDDLVPYQEIPVPLAELTPFDRWANAGPPDGTTGYVVHGQDDLDNLGQGHMVSIDVGSSQGARPGDQLTFYTDSVVSGYRMPGSGGYGVADDYGAAPRTLLGTGVVLRTTPIASTVKIVEAVREIHVGDRVELR